MDCYCTTAVGTRALVQAGRGEWGIRLPTPPLPSRPLGAGSALPDAPGSARWVRGLGEEAALGDQPWEPPSPVLGTPQGTEQDPAWKYSPLRGWLCGRPRAAFPRQPAQKPRRKNLHQPCSCDGGDAAAHQRCQGDEKWVKTRLGEDGTGVCAGRQHCLWAEPRAGLCRC